MTLNAGLAIRQQTKGNRGGCRKRSSVKGKEAASKKKQRQRQQWWCLFCIDDSGGPMSRKERLNPSAFYSQATVPGDRHRCHHNTRGCRNRGACPELAGRPKSAPDTESTHHFALRSLTFPHWRLSNVSTPVLGFVPVARLHKNLQSCHSRLRFSGQGISSLSRPVDGMHGNLESRPPGQHCSSSCPKPPRSQAAKPNPPNGDMPQFRILSLVDSITAEPFMFWAENGNGGAGTCVPGDRCVRQPVVKIPIYPKGEAGIDETCRMDRIGERPGEKRRSSGARCSKKSNSAE